jgi:hypothetical protein
MIKIETRQLTEREKILLAIVLPKKAKKKLAINSKLV